VAQNQAVYVKIVGIPTGDLVELAMCSLSQGNQVVAQPQCASSIPVQSCPQGGCAPTPSPLEYQYGTVTANQTVLSIGTQFDPNIGGAQPIVSQTADQAYGGSNEFGTFFCDNTPADSCGVEVMDIPKSQAANYVFDGLPPRAGYSPVGHAVIIPITFAQSGSGCGSAPIMQVDASYSAAQFLPAAGQATCTGTGGVAAVATDLPSVDDPGCATGSGTHCPITDVINGTVPVTFTDDPEDPATLAEEKQAGGAFAYIPIAVSATEIAFLGGAGLDFAGSLQSVPLSSYQLTPAQSAGITTQFWDSAEAGYLLPNDNLCAQLSGKAQCTLSTQTTNQNLLVETVNGKYDNLDVSQASGQTPKTVPFKTFSYAGNYYKGAGGILGTEKAYAGDTGYALLNPWPFSIGTLPVNETYLAAMFPSTGSGASFESTGWMCAAHNTPYTVNLPFGGQANVQDIMSGQQILADAERGPVPAQNNPNGLSPGVAYQHVLAPPGKCQALSTLPINLANPGTGIIPSYSPSSQPITAAHAMQGAMSKFLGTGGFAFTAMDSSEADFFGLLPATLQNGAGGFVEPTAASITAALNDATTNSDGTVSPNFTSTDAAAYPMPMVTYALVSTSPQPTADQATQLKNLLTNLVNYSYNGATGQTLPAGYVPLPTSLYNQAIAAISTDVVGPGGSTSGGSGGSGGTGGSGGSGGTGGTSGALTPGHPGAAAPGGGGAGSHGVGRGTTAPSSATAASPSSAGSPGNVIGHLITVTVADSRFFVPGLLVLALLCLLAGPLVYLLPTIRRTSAADGKEGIEGAGRGPPEEA
jgi:hypothetical protein